MRHPHARKRSLGQASIEYTVVLVLVMAVLITDSGDGAGSPISQVVTALKDFFGAYSWAISFSSDLTVL